MKIKKEDFFNTKKDFDKKLYLIFNPPYGERLTVNIESFYKNIGDTLKKNYSNSTASFITSNLKSLKFIGLKHKRKIKEKEFALLAETPAEGSQPARANSFSLFFPSFF